MVNLALRNLLLPFTQLHQLHRTREWKSLFNRIANRRAGVRQVSGTAFINTSHVQRSRSLMSRVQFLSTNKFRSPKLLKIRPLTELILSLIAELRGRLMSLNHGHEVSDDLTYMSSNADHQPHQDTAQLLSHSYLPF